MSRLQALYLLEQGFSNVKVYRPYFSAGVARRRPFSYNSLFPDLITLLIALFY